MQNIVTRVIVSFVLSLVFGITGMISAPGPLSPFYMVALFFAVQAYVLVFTGMLYGDIDDENSAKQVIVVSRILGPLKIFTAVFILTIATTAGLPLSYKLIISGIAMWLMLSGTMEVTQQYLSPIWKKRKDNKAFRKEMRKTAEIARFEDSLMSDLNAYLVEEGFANSEEE